MSSSSSRRLLLCVIVSCAAVVEVEADDGLDKLVTVLRTSTDEQLRLDLLTGMLQGLEGRRSVAMPANWPSAYELLHASDNAEVRERALRLALLFDDPVALQQLRTQAQDESESTESRSRALEALVEKRPEGLADLLIGLVADPATRQGAIRGLAEYDHPDTVSAVLQGYRSFDFTTRQDALQTLASRPKWATALLRAIDEGHIPRTDLTAFTVRQLQSLGDPQVARLIEKVWGNVRATSAEKGRLIARYKKRFSTGLGNADLVAGRVLFQKTCANCHRLFDTGERIGPELTGSQRHNLDYILENIFDPSAAVASDFQMQLFATVSGRIITGLVVAETPQAVTIQTVNEKVVVPVDEIEQRQQSSNSLMPDGLLNEFSESQIRDLLAYLASPKQIPLPEENH